MHTTTSMEVSIIEPRHLGGEFPPLVSPSSLALLSYESIPFHSNEAFIQPLMKMPFPSPALFSSLRGSLSSATTDDESWC